VLADLCVAPIGRASGFRFYRYGTVSYRNLFPGLGPDSL
jgi:hypothetical protein